MTEAQLITLIAVADCRSFTLAATQLGISQSAVSHSIRQLEQSLSVNFFHRNGADIILTDVGEQILRYAREITGLFDGVRQEAANSQGIKTGTLRIGSFGPSASLHLLPELLTQFHKRYPNVDVHITEGTDHDVLRWLHEHRIDIGFVVLPEKQFDTHYLATDQMVVVLPEAHKLAGQSSISLSDICQEPFILTGAGSAEIVKRLFSQEQLSPRIQFHISQVLSTLAYIERGQAITIMAELSLPEGYQKHGVIKRALSPKYQRDIGIAFKPSQQQSPATRAFIQLIQKGK